MYENLLLSVGVFGHRRPPWWRPLVRPETQQEARRVMEQYRIADSAETRVDRLPQGVRKLLDIAMAMVGGPAMILLDEPTSGISTEEKFDVMGNVIDALRSSGATVLFVEHDMDVVGDVTPIVSSRSARGGCWRMERRGRCSRIRPLSSTWSAAARHDLPMLETRKLTVRFGGSTILHDVDLRVEGFTGLVGRNGAGKTTLMRAVMGLIRTHSGHVLLNGQDITAVPAHRRTRAGVGYMPEDRRLIPGLTVEENLLLPAWGTRRPDGRDRCERALAYVSEVADMRSRPCRAAVRGAAEAGGAGACIGVRRAGIAARRTL